MTPARKVFVSYSRTDRSFVAVAIQLLRAGGASVFYDAVSIELGDQWQRQLERAVEQCERMLVFWSLAAASSAWVDREWRQAMSLGKRIVPLQLDSTPLPEGLAGFQGIVGLMDTLREALEPAPVAAAPARPPARADEAPDPFAALETRRTVIKPVPGGRAGSGPMVPDDWGAFADIPPGYAPGVFGDLFGGPPERAQRFVSLLFGETPAA